MVRFLCLCLLAGVAFHVTPAGSDEVKPERIIVTFALGDLASNDDRRAFASAVLKYCQSARSMVPTPTPAEKEWVQAELKASGNRLSQVLQSSLFARSTLADYYDACTQWALALTLTPEATNSIYSWAGLLSVMIDTRVSDYTTRLDVPLPEDFEQGADAVPHFIARGIVNKIIMPLSQ